MKRGGAAQERRDHRQSLPSTLFAEIREHYNPIVQVISSWRLYRELRNRQVETRSLRQAGQRVPNWLWRSQVQQRNGQRSGAWSSILSVIVACGLLIPLWLQFYTASLTAPLPYNIFVPDLLMVLIALALCPATWLLIHAIFDPRWIRLWQIGIARRRLAKQSLKENRTLLSSRSAPRRLALLLGVAVYLSLLAAAAGVGNMPPALIVVSAAVGHARALPIVLFPIAAEILAGLYRQRRRRRRRLVNAGLASLSLQATP